MPEIEWHAHYRCAHCHGLKPKTEIVHVQGIPLCLYGSCQHQHLAAKRYTPRSVSLWEHG